MYASTVLLSSEVFYDNSKSGGSSSSVQGALEELYQKSNSGSCLGENSNFIVAYTYNPSSCITGAEATCKVTTMGTIIEYKVNSNTVKTFHVLPDDGKEMTMQQRENTIYNVVWNSDDDKTKGPLTELSKLEEKTQDWTNVNTQTYTMGTTNFNGTNAYTGCSYIRESSDVNTCTMNTYTLEKRSAKSRLITVQEVLTVGCQYITSNTCPNFMNNYLSASTSNGGTINDTHVENGASVNRGYLSMNAISTDDNHVFVVGQDAGIARTFTTKDIERGARTVVEVSK